MGMLAAKVHRQPTDSTIAPPIAGPAAAATRPAPGDADGRRPPIRSEGVEHQGEHRWPLEGNAGGLHDPGGDQEFDGRRQSDETRTEQEHREPGREHRARPYRSAAQPPGTINAPMVIENAVSAQDTVVPSASKVSAISPKATN